jgi:hypothetical protein
MNRLGIMAGGLVLLGAALAGCSASVIQGGPLGRGMDPPSSDTQCIDMQRGDVVVDGFNTIPNSGRQVAVVDKVTFADPVGLRQIAAYIIPRQRRVVRRLDRLPAQWRPSSGEPRAGLGRQAGCSRCPYPAHAGRGASQGPQRPAHGRGPVVWRQGV